MTKKILSDKQAHRLFIVGCLIIFGLLMFTLGSGHATKKPIAVNKVTQTAISKTPSNIQSSPATQPLPQSSHGQFMLYGTVASLTSTTLDIQTQAELIDGLELTPITRVIDASRQITSIEHLKTGQPVSVFVTVEQAGAFYVEQIVVQSAR